MLAAKICVVTGATSGIGAATAVELAARGACVVLVGRNTQRGRSVTADIEARGGRAFFIEADLADRTAPDRIVEGSLRHFGRIDVLVNNAGMLINGTAEETSDADWDRIMDVNLASAMRMSRAVIHPMREARKGSIINVASDWALMGARGALAYCVSKAALAQLTRCMALDHAADGIRVNAVCPGDTDTPMLDQAFEGDGRDWKLEKLAATIPMGRVARVDEVAKVIAFLASDDASFMTGALVPIDGGTSAQ
ncbi:MAG: dihydroanticapsin 7-dehydrogenase [Pseudomonadota bacterium]|jgi:NAD(P)-dependent dehydrogenase (short-subunit alcohol dehydrogenase family)